MTEQTPHAEKTSDSQALSDEQLGLAGRTARFFINSPLSPLFFLAMLAMGFLGLVMTPRQEDPQISVPMVDIFVQYPGASAEQVSSLAIEPLERIMSEIQGINHVYSASQRGQGMVTVEFEVGEEMGPSLVKVNDKLDSNMDKIPPGVKPPMVKAKGIDDVPVVNITLWSKDLDQDGTPDVDDGQLRMLAHDVLQSVKEIPNTGNGFVVGGRSEQVTIEVFPERLSGFGISLDQVAQTIRTANSEQQAGGVESGDSHFSVITGSFLTSVDDVARLVVGTHNNVPVYVHDVARVKQGPEDAQQLVSYYTGRAAPEDLFATGAPAVTVAVAKKHGSNGVTVAEAVIKRVNEIKGSRIPDNVQVSITRDYGKSADDKVNSLIFKLFVATAFVFLLVWGAFRALRPAIVVMLVIPVVLLFTIFGAWVSGLTIDRVSLFALIFSIGILVDDAIVVVENIYRRWLEEGKTDVDTAVDAVREVGNPTILATFTVIAALLPMGFVTGMMGPYMAPIPVLGSMAMLVSLFAAFVFTPYLAISNLLRPTMRYLSVAEKREHAEAEKMERLYRRILTPLIESKAKRLIFRVVLWGTFFIACSMFYFNLVAVKMLPLDNKPEFSVVLDMPEGTALPVTANMAHKIAEKIRQMPEVTAIQLYVGTAKPFDFNGMVRHYYLRSSPWQAEVQVQLVDKGERSLSSHKIAVKAREMLVDLIRDSGAKVAVVEMPPGPPVLQSVVAEVHGPSSEVRRQVATELTAYFQRAESLRDVDNYMRDPFEYWRFSVDTEKAVRRGISVDAINRNLSMALGGMVLGDVKQRAGHEPTQIVIQVPLAERSQVTRLGDLPIQSGSGMIVPLRELGQFEKVSEEPLIYHKDLRPVEYVVADVGGHLAAPVYGMFQVQDLLAADDYTAPDGVRLHGENAMEDGFFWFTPPPNDSRTSIEWTGEWTVTFETFRDMGGAFMIALVLIYILVVWEFGNFRIPLVIMAPIPLTLLGIIPAHMLFFQMGWGGEFTATSMIGWIALAGIIVRNSILLVDFSVHEVQRGIPVAEAVIRACKTRTRPIMITAFALVCGSSVIFFDPIFQGMAISLASGVMVSTILTLVVIPLGCIAASDSLYEVAAAGAGGGAASQEVEKAREGERQLKASPAAAGSRKESLGMVVWGKVVAVLMFLFYAIRGLGLLLLQMFRNRRRERPAPPPAAKAPAPAPAAQPVAPAPQAPSAPAEPRTPTSSASAVEENVTDASAPQAAPKPVAPKPEESKAAPAPRTDSESKVTAVAPPPRTDSESKVTAVAPPPESADVASALQHGEASAETKPESPAKGAGGNSRVAKKKAAQTTKQDAAKPKESKKKAATTGAKGRRGIRLKKGSDEDFEL